MKIYLDVVFLINLGFDFLLLLSTSFLLKRNIPLKRILLGSLIGASSIFFLFINLTSFLLFLLKVIVSIIMILTTFSFKNISYFIKNITYLYFISMLLGGSLYFLNMQFSLYQEGFLFINNGFSINVLILLIISPFLLYFYIKELKHHFKTNKNIHQVDILLNNNLTLHLNGYLDTGNQLYDVYKHRPITLVYLKNIDLSKEKSIITPFETLNEKGIITCLKVVSLIIDKTIIYHDALIGLSINPFKIEGVDCILPNDYMEDKE